MANIALGKLTSQSSTKPGVDDQSFTSSWAVDGAIDGSPHSHFARTDTAYTAGASSWWMIDLEREYTVLKFSVYPRPAAYDFPSEFALHVWSGDVHVQKVNIGPTYIYIYISFIGTSLFLQAEGTP